MLPAKQTLNYTHDLRRNITTNISHHLDLLVQRVLVAQSLAAVAVGLTVMAAQPEFHP